jgi:hypothetical protein
VTGLIFFGVVIAYVALFWGVAAKVKSALARVATIAVALLIPFWEFPIGYWNLHLHCRNESGNHISKEFAPSPSIVLDFTFPQRPREVMTLGFDIVEYASGNKITRYAKSGDGMTETIHEAAISQIEYRREIVKPLPWNLERYDHVVARRSDGKIVARQTDFNWRGTWWEKLLNARVLPGGQCAGARDTALISALPRKN